MPLELTDRRPAETIRVPLTDPQTGDATDAAVLIAGPYSKAGRAAAERVSAAGVEGRSDLAFLDELLAHATVGFENVTVNGAPVTTVDADGARALYDEFPWMLPQVREAYGTTARFFEKPSPPSSRTRRTKRNSAK